MQKGLWSQNSKDILPVRNSICSCHKMNDTMSSNLSEIYLAGGCFWGTEHFMKLIDGVKETCVGYANGHTENPTYKEVCSHTTGFAETVHVKYDKEVAPLDFLLDLFFMTIDPTSLNRQGGDRGTQYRTGVYYTDEADLPVIKAALEKLQARYTAKVVVECEPLKNFYPAEDYHQDYLDVNPGGYCHIDVSLFQVAKNARYRK